MRTYYQSVDNASQPLPVATTRTSSIATFALATILACVVALCSCGISSQNRLFVRPRPVLRPLQLPVTFAAKSGRSFSFGKPQEEEEPPAKSVFNFNLGSKKTQPASSVPAKTSFSSNEALANVGKITGVGAKVVSELAVYLTLNTAYFITNTYEYLNKEEQRALAKQTVDKQLPELLALLGGTTETLGKTVSAVAQTEEYQELQKSAAETASKLTKGIKTDTPTPEVLQKLKQIVADEKGEVFSDERKSAIAETLKKGGIKGAELSLYLFYNVFSILKNLDKVLPTSEQTLTIEDKIQQLEVKLAELAEQVKELPSKRGQITQKVEELRKSIPTAEELANLDPAEVSMAVRSSLASAKNSLDKTYASFNTAMKEDSEFRKNVQELNVKLQPVADVLKSLLDKLPLPKKPDGSIDYTKLLTDSGIVTVKGVKALIEATKNAAASIQAKEEPRAIDQGPTLAQSPK